MGPNHAIGVPVPDVLILIACVVVLTLLLGLPLLLKPDSPIPDIIGFGILAAFVLFYVWSMGDWWIILPILAVLALMAWLDREGQEARPERETGMSDRTRLRFRLWRAAHYVQLALIAFVLISFATGFAATALRPIVSCMVIMMVAGAAFRFSCVRSARRDRRVLAGAAGPVET